MPAFDVWKLHHSTGGKWTKTAQTVTARTGAEAMAKIRKRFARAGFHSMSLCVIPQGETPETAVSNV